ncbi:hypothetical protein LUZ61_012717 [Rhynchospora tenuis]|uniref:Disease resistance protein n=1 Tax=Rhynchospora tenuis TaxID=198213 RepID=A0AAD6A3H4_9POAL|nr:hypothetical protein LUZ61_012717 [Rhynchospora tenuis]
MAEGIVSFVLEKLADVTVKEMLHLKGVGEQAEKMSNELRWIQAFLKDADRRRIVDERQKQWVKEVRDVAYDIEDAIDTFLLEELEEKSYQIETVSMVASTSSLKQKLKAVVKKLVRKPKRLVDKAKKLPAVHKLGNEFNMIEAKIRQIKENTETYKIPNLGEGIEEEIELVPRIVPLGVNEVGIVGFDADKDKVVSLLLDKKTTNRSMISIVGTGGLGKTTLARKVYNSEAVRQQFCIRIWVTVSQKFELIDILRKIAEQLGISPPNDLSEHQVTGIHQSLEKENYLIVMDDIWEKNNPWNQIESIFPDANNGSRILVTSRFTNVAKAEPISVLHDLQPLTEEQSLELFLKKAIPNQDVNDIHDDLSAISKKFVKKCNGLPLALVVLGGLLRRKNFITWSRVLETLDWAVDGKDCVQIIGTSYDDLTFALKSCFMYFAIFPEDAEIYARNLILMWIAEGFIPQQENKTMEDTAEIFLEDLVQRSMIQVSNRGYDGSITSCHIHDILHDLAIKKAREENFLMAVTKVDDMQNCSQMRRLAIHDEASSSELMTSAIPNLRTLFYYGEPPKIAHLMRLKVLSDSGYDDATSDFEPDKFGRFQARYIQVAFKLREEEKNYFGKFIGGMRFLQTLSIKFCIHLKDDCELPDCIWDIKTLRHVTFLNRRVLGPPPLVDLTNLQTLYGVTARESWRTQGLPKLSNVKWLNIYSHTGQDQDRWNAVITLLGTMKHLSSLYMEGPYFPLKTIDMRCFPFYHRLQNLCLYRDLKSIPDQIALDVGMLPKNLITLLLSAIEFREDPFPVLEKLENLRFLYMINSKLVRLCCSAGGFGQLEELKIVSLMNLREWKIEEGAMPILKIIRISDCYELRVPLGLQYLTNLQELHWGYNRTSETEKHEISSICRHVPTVHIF